jgi:ATP-dependent Clp protease ATP-binding subunit ClpC
MIFSIPIFIEERSSGPARPPTFIVRPLFHAEPMQRAEKLSRALTKLSNELHDALRLLGDEPRHDALAEWTFNPWFEENTVELRLELTSGSHRKSFFLAGYSALDRKLYFSPSLPHLRFEVLPGQSLAERATAVFTRHFRELEREAGSINLDDYALLGKARLTVLDVALSPGAQAKKAKKNLRALLFGGEEKMDGEQELRKTSRPLHSMYPDDLDRALGREREVEELARLLAGPDRRPILLVGPRKVGKTTILHELVWRMCERKKERYGGSRDVWLVSPMRLISGMSYLGQWENRVLAILEHAKKKDRVLYFDDLLGLFFAGMSSASDLNVAQVLKPVLEKRSVRVIAEIAPEAWRVLRERDRAFADLFHVIPIQEPTEPETLRILVDVARQLEEEHGCHFDLEVVPTVYELHRRFSSDTAFPGKAAGFLRRLAVRFANFSRTKMNRYAVLHQFQTESGLQTALIDNRQVLDRKSVVQQMAHGLVGQAHAVDAFADVVLTLKARLNDSKRPLGTFLMLGPTGVGKTQAAKMFSEYLFGSSERLLRFDMNEFVEGRFVSRLTGTPQEPDGLLTAAIRRQPFSVVLFDEIEKAAPEVFDMLLAVLDEGRLTDALGRVADFTQSVILLTSNLGAREARSRLGFGAETGGSEADDAIYVSAAEKFFRPEFFNRLDRIIPFRSLDHKQLEGIARQLLGSIFARDGLQRRDGVVNFSKDAMDRLVQLGYHPQLGARALKRVVERELAQPLGEKLAAFPPGVPMIANFKTEGNAFAVNIRELRPVERSVFWTEKAVARRSPAEQARWTDRILDGVYAALDRIEADIEAIAPAGKIELSNLPPDHARYFFCREQLKKVDHLVRAAERAQGAPRRNVSTAKLPKAKPTKLLIRQRSSGSPGFDRQLDAITLRQNLADLEPEAQDIPDSPLLALLRESALLEAMAATPLDENPAMLILRASVHGDLAHMLQLGSIYLETLGHVWGVSITPILGEKEMNEAMLRHMRAGRPGYLHGFYLKGLNLRRLLPAGSHCVLVRRENNVGILQVTLDSISSEEAARETFKKLEESKEAPAPEEHGPVFQIITENKSLTDFRTGLVVSARPSPEEFRALLLSALPLPREVEQAMRSAN